MKKQLEQRLNELKAEFESGQKMMANLENEQVNLRDTLLRISGAIQVLEELSATLNCIEEVPEQAGQNIAKSTSQKAEMEVGFPK